MTESVQKNRSRLARRRGQNTAEYLLLMTLVVISAIGLIAMYGGQIKAKFAMVGATIAGHAEHVSAAQELTKVTSYESNLRVKQRTVKVEGIERDELEFSAGR